MNKPSFANATFCPRALAQARMAALVNDYRAYLSLIHVALLLLSLDKADQTARAADEEGNAVTKDLDGKPRKVTDANGSSPFQYSSISARTGHRLSTQIATSRFSSNNTHIASGTE